jgi:hypothetical protein
MITKKLEERYALRSIRPRLQVGPSDASHQTHVISQSKFNWNIFQDRLLTSISIYTKMINTGNNAPTNATQTKERLYAQLALSLGRMSRAVSQTADLCEQLQVDLHAMRIFAGLDAAKYVLSLYICCLLYLSLQRNRGSES